jgi:drug/metabolite transporter (DMT)-like permease
MTALLVEAIVAGVAFSLIALAYRSGAARGVPPSFAAMGMGLAGTFWFGWRSFAGTEAPGWDAPAVVWVWGLVNGLAQGGAVRLFRAGFKHGPLAPVWCAANLTFVTPALFAVGLMGERLIGLQWAGMAAACGCVVVSAAGHGEEPGEGHPHRAVPRERLLYGGILLGLILLTGLVGVALKHMTVLQRNGIPMNPRWNDCFMLSLYGALLVTVFGESLRHGRPAGVAVGWLAGNGLLAAFGSIAGMTLTARVSRLPGGMGFAAIGVATVLIGVLIGALGFGEKRGPAWYATVALAVAAVILFKA